LSFALQKRVDTDRGQLVSAMEETELERVEYEQQLESANDTDFADFGTRYTSSRLTPSSSSSLSSRENGTFLLLAWYNRVTFGTSGWGAAASARARSLAKREMLASLSAALPISDLNFRALFATLCERPENVTGFEWTYFCSFCHSLKWEEKVENLDSLLELFSKFFELLWKFFELFSKCFELLSDFLGSLDGIGLIHRQLSSFSTRFIFFAF
jgi:hypothetical protein